MALNVKPQSWPLIAGGVAIVGSPLLQVATGSGELFQIWLAVLFFAVWGLLRLTRHEIGFTLGDGRSYLIALAYVVIIIGLVALGAWTANLIDLSDFSATTSARRLALNFLATFVLTLLTEDGFFRGALWGSCLRAGFSPAKTLIWTSVAFGVWHLAVPILEPDFAQSLSKVPQYVIGSTAFGVAMGLLRLRSGSVVVPSACHALWNATVYTFFGAGQKTGQLGITDPTIWDPERGYVGLALAIIAAIALWVWIKPSDARP